MMCPRNLLSNTFPVCIQIGRIFDRLLKSVQLPVETPRFWAGVSRQHYVDDAAEHLLVLE